MAITATFYNTFKTRKLDEGVVIPMAAGTISVPEGTSGVASELVYSTIQVILTTSSYVPDAAAHVYRSSVTNEVSSGAGYTTGGQALASKVVGYDTNGGFAYFDAADVVWPLATFTARRAVLFFNTGTQTTSLLIGWYDFGVNKTGNGGDFTLRWAAPSSGGVLRLK